MKKVFLFIAVVSAFSFASCKKDRVCTCVVTPGGYTQVTTYTAAKKGDAMSHCLNQTWIDDSSGSNVTYTAACTLK